MRNTVILIARSQYKTSTERGRDMQVRIRHVVWQDCCYHFRYVVPSDIRGYVGRGELKRSLHTTLPLEAQAAARHLAGMVERHLTLIRSHPRDAASGPRPR